MTRRRITVSLIAAAATAMALVTPAQAAEAEAEPGSVDLSSNLSSSAPEENEADESEPGNDEENGEGGEDPQGNLGSLESTEEMELTFAILEAIMAVGTATTTGLITYVNLVPGADDQVRNFLGQFGIQP